jgi:hypothetical protein
MTEEDGFLIEAALQLGFQMTNDDGDEFACTEGQLLEFAKRVKLATERRIARAQADRMTTIVGKYVTTFAEADMGMLEDASLNAPYKFHWVYLKSIEGDHIICTGGGDEMRLPFKSTPRGDRAIVTVHDPIFGPTLFEVHPFKRRAERRP